MRHNILYAYVEGADLDDVASTLEARFTSFVADRKWISGDAWVVNQKHGQVQPSDELLGWDLGINLELPNPSMEPNGWFSDVEEIATFLRLLSADTGRSFVIGIGDTRSGISDDLYFVDSGPMNIERLRAIIGVQENTG